MLFACIFGAKLQTIAPQLWQIVSKHTYSISMGWADLVWQYWAELSISVVTATMIITDMQFCAQAWKMLNKKIKKYFFITHFTVQPIYIPDSTIPLVVHYKCNSFLMIEYPLLWISSALLNSEFFGDVEVKIGVSLFLHHANNSLWALSICCRFTLRLKAIFSLIKIWYFILSYSELCLTHLFFSVWSLAHSNQYLM